MESKLVQIFDQTSIWTEIGYEVTGGRLELGQYVSLKRRADCTPAFYGDAASRLIEPDESISLVEFNNAEEQAKWLANDIEKNVSSQELLYRDILVVLPSAWTAKSNFATIAAALRNKDIPSHLVGISSSRDEVFQDSSIAITHIFRAKGNEAPFVYVLNAQECISGLELAKKRNTLFTAITRSRAWVRILGHGSGMKALVNEFNACRSSEYSLNFVYPTDEQIKKMRSLHRDRPAAVTKNFDLDVQKLDFLLDQLVSGEISIESLPEKVRQNLTDLFKTAK